MNIVLVHPEEAVDAARTRFVLSDRRAAHLREVLEVGVGDEVRVGLRDGLLGAAEVVASHPAGVELTCRWSAPAPAPWLDLVLAIPRPKQLKRLLPQIAAFGLRRLTFLRTWRVQLPYLSSPMLGPPGYGPLFEEGLMQAGRTAWPEVRRFDRFEAFCADAAGSPDGGGTRLLADPRADDDLAARTTPLRAPVELVIGPEGGLLPYEVERLANAGFAPVRAGPSILRTDTACVAIAAQLDLLIRRSVPD